VPVARHCGRRLQIGAERGCIFESLIYARFANRPIESIKRSDIVRLLDDMQRSTAHTEPSRARHPVEALQLARQPGR
jgi:hypothetical protein